MSRPACRRCTATSPRHQREQVLKNFRKGKFTALVATDVAARGLDIPDVDLVRPLSYPFYILRYLDRAMGPVAACHGPSASKQHACSVIRTLQPQTVLHMLESLLWLRLI